MWKLEHIEAENLCAFRTLDYTLRQGVTTLVFGDNRDNDSQRSNGSGKSALIEAIAVGITGSPLRKVRGEEIINDAAGECRVRLRLRNDAAAETFIIERRIPRKGVSTVECRIERNGRVVTTDEAVQPSVDAYNRYILEKLGLTREELFNTFILSKHKYQDFLSASDTQKKEIINRFSNASLVDRAIEKVADDILPVENALQQAALALAGLDGRVEMLAEQIRREEQAAEEKARSREERIAAIRESVAAKHALIREKNTALAALQKHTIRLEQADALLQQTEEGDDAVEVCSAEVRKLFSQLGLGGLTDWDTVLETKREKLSGVKRELETVRSESSQTETSLGEFARRRDELQKRYDAVREESRQKARQHDSRLRELDGLLATANARLSDARHARHELLRRIEALKGQLSGVIRCPSCRHEFLLADEAFDIAAGRDNLRQEQERLQAVDTDIRSLNGETEQIETQQDRIRRDKRVLAAADGPIADELSQAEHAVRDADSRLRRIQQRQRQIETELDGLQGALDGIRRKLFDEAFALVDDACRRNEREVRRIGEEIRSAESAVATLEETVEELKNTSSSELIRSLEVSLKEARRKSGEATAGKEEIEQKLHRLQEQQERFVQFKSFLAGTKIEALNRITNEFLANIGSDIRLRLSGFTLLKTGKLREKISASLVRDGVDCGSFGKFSQGEAARVHLATILAMQRLVNGGCEADKGLDLLVLDEILDAMDESGLASTFGALNRLGITSLVVSHGNVAEGYEHKLVIVKEHGESRIG